MTLISRYKINQDEAVRLHQRHANLFNLVKNSPLWCNKYTFLKNNQEIPLLYKKIIVILHTKKIIFK